MGKQALRLQGLDKGINDNAFQRGIVIHGGNYVGADKQGTSWGCFTVPTEVAPQLIGMAKNGSIIHAYTPTPQSLQSFKQGLPQQGQQVIDQTVHTNVQKQLSVYRSLNDPQYADKVAKEQGLVNPSQVSNMSQQFNNTFYQNPNAPRGLRNNNPGNIEKTNGKWGPEISGKDPRFATYATPEQGLTALNNLLDNRYNGLSLTTIIGKYAPKNENNTQSYISTLAKSTGLDPNSPVDMSNPQTKAAIIKGIIQIENGHQPYPDEMIQSAISGQIGTTNSSNQSTTSISPLSALGPQNTPKPPQPKEIAPAQPTPQEHATYEDLTRQLDRGNDSYSLNGGINWDILKTKPREKG
jgi:hypothetical protein